jgi:hypothetical protein
LTYSLQFQLTTTGLEMVNGVFIDNSVNSQGFTLLNPTTGQLVFIPAFSQGRLALLTSQSSDNVQFVGSSSGGVDVPVMFTNTEPVSDLIWAVIPPGSTAGTVVVAGQVTTLPLAASVTPRNATIAVGGTSQILMPANLARRRLIIQNPYTPTGEGIASAEPIYFRYGAVAGIDDGTSFEIYPGAAYDSSNGPVYNGAIQVNAASTGHRIIATEF